MPVTYRIAADRRTIRTTCTGDVTLQEVISREENSPVFKLLAEAVRTLVPTLEKFHIASAAQVHIETLTDRLRKEVVATARRPLVPFSERARKGGECI